MEERLLSLFVSMLNLGLAGGLAALLVLPVRLALSRAPKRYSCWLWAAVFFRFACPFVPQSPLALVAVRQQAIVPEIQYQAVPHIDTGLAPLDGAVNRLLPAATPMASANPVQLALLIGARVWAVGAVLLLAWTVLSTLTLALRLRTAAQTEPGVYEAPGLETPFVLGLVRPRIYLPEGLCGQERVCILAHERAHIRRGHPLAKAAAWGIACLHWMDPLVWLAYWLLGRDLEMACDEQVMADLGGGQKKVYAATLLNQAAGRRAGVPLAFGEGNVKGRIHRVLAWRSLPHGAAVLLAVLTLAVGAGLLFARPQKTVEAQAGWPVTEVTMALPAGRPAGTLPLALPEGWQVGENGVIATADGTGVGAVMLGMTMDLPEDLPREDYYKAAMAELRLSSVMTLEDYTPVSRGDSWEKATAVFGISDYVLSDGYASNAEAPLREHPAVTEFDWEQGIYALVWFDPDCFAGLGLTDAQAMELVAQGLGTLRTAQ